MPTNSTGNHIKDHDILSVLPEIKNSRKRTKKFLFLY